MFLVHLATIPITGTGINPARSLGAAIFFNKDEAWDDHVSLLNLEAHVEMTNLLLCDVLKLKKCCFFAIIFSGFSGLDHSLEQLLLQFTIR